MQKEPTAEQCIKGICKVVEDFCNNQHCADSKPLSDVKAVYMVFFRTNGKARMHMIGELSIADLVQSTEHSIHEIMRQNEEEGNLLAS